MAAASSLVVTVTNWPIPASGNRVTTGWRGGQIESATSLGWEPGILNGNGCKPKGMHWSTFERLTAQHDAFVQTSLARITARFSLPNPW